MAVFSQLHPYLQQQLLSGQLSHAYIFTGSQGEEQGEALAAALECLTPGENGLACGVCQACRNVALRVHPDVRWLAPQGAQHKVEAMRELVADAGLSRMAGPFKVYLLQQAERISPEGANTLLKLLEEPVPNTVLVLLVEQADLLLPTILSRCQQFSFDPQDDSPEPEGEMQAAAQAFLSDLPQMPIYQVLLHARAYEKDRLGQRAFLFCMLEHLHRQAKGQGQLPWSRLEALQAAELLDGAMEQMEKGMNQKLLVDVLYLRLRQICVS